MAKQIKQIEITEALEKSKLGEKVYVLTLSGKPVVKSFNNMSVGDVLSSKTEFIFFVLEEAVE